MTNRLMCTIHFHFSIKRSIQVMQNVLPKEEDRVGIIFPHQLLIKIIQNGCQFDGDYG